MKRALIVGSEGQDGKILFDRLAADGWAVIGIGRESVRGTERTEIRNVDVTSKQQVAVLLARWEPDEIYYLPAVHQASQDPLATDDAALLARSLDVHVAGLVHFLNEIAERRIDASLFYAASSLVFGNVSGDAQDEQTPLRPRCIYGITKAAGVHLCRFYRETHRVRASVGFLYNHESSLRRPTFVSQKIVRAAAAIARDSNQQLVLGDLSARIDWGYAPDFIDAIIRIVRRPDADDYIVATGETHSVQEFVEIAFSRLGLDWRKHVVEDRSLLTRPSVVRVGDATRLRERTGWRPTVTFAEMIEILLDSAQRNVA